MVIITIADWQHPKHCDTNMERDEADGNTEDLRYFPSVSIKYHWTMLESF